MNREEELNKQFPLEDGTPIHMWVMPNEMID